MLIVHKKTFTLGFVLAVTFFIILFYMFTPNFGEHGGKKLNAFEASDNLFNSISKGSSYFIDDLKAKNAEFMSKDVAFDLPADKIPANLAVLLQKSGLQVTPGANGMNVKGDFGKMMAAAIDDSDLMFYNKGADVAAKYAMPEKDAMKGWWNILRETKRELDKQSKFALSKWLSEVQSRAVEVGYNFYGVDPEKASTKAGILTFLLVFYVIYTLWYGYSMYFMFDGLGMKMKGGKKKEM